MYLRFTDVSCVALYLQTINYLPLPFSLCQKMLDSLPSQSLPDITASIVKASYAEKIQVLDAIDLRERFKRTLPLLMRQIEAIISSFIFHCFIYVIIYWSFNGG